MHTEPRALSMVDPKQGQDISSVDDAEVNFLQHKTGRTRADIIGAIRRVGHDRRNVLKELSKN
jgi:hypothetical protein